MIKINADEVVNDLHTIADFLRWASSRFTEAQLYFGHGTDNSWDEAIALLLHTLYLAPQKDDNLMQCRLTKTEKLEFIDLVEQRIEKRIPAPYLTNTAYFAKLPFYVDDRVLVPRSPIAELIEEKFAGYINNPETVNRILDLCCGSACIAIACAYAFPDAEIDAIDLSNDALDVATINIENHDLFEQVIPIKSDLFTAIPHQKYDVIVTNPPYVDAQDMDELPPEYLHEPQMGLACGDDGLDIVRNILAQAADYLNDDGILICEVGNSYVHVQDLYPEVPFTWHEFKRGGHGVFVLTKAQLIAFSETFAQQVKN